jgi:selenium metabolism protein YedF
MSHTDVDARGQICPKPLIMTKQALGESAVGASFTVLIDNETSCQNVERFLRDNGLQPQVNREGNLFSITFANGGRPLAAPNAETYCVPANASIGGGSYVVSLAADTVGRGPEELGAILVKGLIETLKSVNPAPTHLILYSSAILLAVDDSPLVESIRALEQRGIKVLICGTCVDYYQKKSEIHVGTISNMLSILEVQAATGKVIAP